MNIYEKLLTVQSKLKVPKGQYSEFRTYRYRNCEDILESAKPHMQEVKATVLLSDEIVRLEERFYVKATASLVDVEKPTDTIVVTAYAREEESKKGMDGSQVTGASSSYARKYALNGLFNIDDTKDSDSTNRGDNDTTNKDSTKRTAPTETSKTDKTTASTAASTTQHISGIRQFTLAEAYDRKTKAGKTYGELKEENLQYIIDSEQAHPDSKICAKLVLDDKQGFEDLQPIDNGDLPF